MPSLCPGVTFERFKASGGDSAFFRRKEGFPSLIENKRFHTKVKPIVLEKRIQIIAQRALQEPLGGPVATMLVDHSDENRWCSPGHLCWLAMVSVRPVKLIRRTDTIASQHR